MPPPTPLVVQTWHSTLRMQPQLDLTEKHSEGGGSEAGREGGSTEGGGCHQEADAARGEQRCGGGDGAAAAAAEAARPQLSGFSPQCSGDVSSMARSASWRSLSGALQPACASRPRLLRNSRAMLLVGAPCAAPGPGASQYPLAGHPLRCPSIAHQCLAAQAAAAAECWHDVQASTFQDPVTGEDVVMLIQTDVTSRVQAEQQLAKLLEAEHQLLEEIFPRQVLEAMAAGGISSGPARTAPGGLPPQATGPRLGLSHDQVSVLFADICGFTSMAEAVEPDVVMHFLNDLYTRFDELLEASGVYKVETIGDCYMCVGGLITTDHQGFKTLLQSQVDAQHAQRTFSFAQAMLAAAAAMSMPHNGRPVQLRVGIHSGPVMSGIVGLRMPRFCLFGDTVNTASRMQSSGRPGFIHLSADTAALLDASVQLAPSGGVEVKGKGAMDTFYWAAPAGAAASCTGEAAAAAAAAADCS